MRELTGMTGSDHSSDRVHPGRVLVLGLLLLFAHQAAVSRGGTGAEGTPAAQSGATATAEATTAAVRIVVGFDGSCPHDPAGVKQEGPGRFRIFPSCRSSPGIDEKAVSCRADETRPYLAGRVTSPLWIALSSWTGSLPTKP
jgi:hypothetical protein